MRSTAQREAAAFPLFFVGLWACCLCGFMRRGFWSFFLAPKDLQGRAGAPRSSQWSLGVAAKAASFNSLAHWASASLFPPLAALGSAPPTRGGCPWYPAKKQPLSRLPAFAPPPPGPTAHPDPAPPPAALPAAVRAIFLYRRPRFLRFLPSAPLASSPNVKNGPQSRSFPFLPRRATPHGPPWDLRRWFWRRPSAPPRPPCSPWPPAGGRRDASRPPSPGLRPGLPVWRRGPRPRQPNAAPPAQRPCSPLPPGFRAYYRAFVCILAHVPYRCPYRAN